MKTTNIVLPCRLLLVLVLAASGQAGESKSRYPDPSMPAYRVETEGFNASAQDIKAVCDSAGRELWRFFPGYKIEPFVVTRSRQGPIVLFKRNPRGEIVLKLDTESTYWSQYSYQFAHEFCHVLCGFDEDYQGNKWFEETLCETASLFAMRSMAAAWADDPPYPHWKDYRHSLRKYADDVIAKREKVLEIYEKGLRGFYLAHQEQLQSNSGDRELNGAMSVVFLRLFEQQPERWEAVRWLNASPSPKGETFQQYVQKWHNAVPDRHKPFVKRVAGLYGVAIEATGAPEMVESPRRVEPNGRGISEPTRAGYADPQMPSYRVEADGFDASARDVKAVCDSAGREL